MRECFYAPLEVAENIPSSFMYGKAAGKFLLLSLRLDGSR